MRDNHSIGFKNESRDMCSGSFSKLCIRAVTVDVDQIVAGDQSHGCPARDTGTLKIVEDLEFVLIFKMNYMENTLYDSETCCSFLRDGDIRVAANVKCMLRSTDIGNSLPHNVKSSAMSRRRNNDRQSTLQSNTSVKTGQLKSKRY